MLESFPVRLSYKNDGECLMYAGVSSSFVLPPRVLNLSKASIKEFISDLVLFDSLLAALNVSIKFSFSLSKLNRLLYCLFLSMLS